MKLFKTFVLTLFLIVTFLIVGSLNLTYDASIISESSSPRYYQYHQLHRQDGIGKLYQGREIAKVMGHREFLWLERPSRESQEKPSQVVAALDLSSEDMVADIGAGSGYFTFRLSPLVPQGKVFAVDIQPEMLEVIDFLKEENNVSNVETILGTVKKPKLPPDKIDLALMVDAYHEFAYPREMMATIVDSLKLGGRVVLAEYRRENPFIPIKMLHKMTERQVKKEMASVGLVWQKTVESLPQQHLIFFEKHKID
ncbi:MAG: methyltransferase domain-containing protein [Cyanobacteria bacterium P01_G01_bin.49]